MENETLIQNIRFLAMEFLWFEQVLEIRLRAYLGSETSGVPILPVPPDWNTDASAYSAKLRLHDAQPPERLLMVLALAPYLKPHLLDAFFLKNKLYERGYTEFGGMLGQQHSGFLPTGETALFLLAGDDLNLRAQFMELFDESHFFFQSNILRLEGAPSNEPYISGALVPTQEFLAYFTQPDGVYRPKFSAQFPARRIQTPLTRADLILDPNTEEEIDEIQSWLANSETLMHDWQLGRNLKPGYRALFYGPPGTGKTLTAILLGQMSEREVYCIDLSQVVSKYIGETEKNLANIFNRAERSNWILFFDEADALFGKRSMTKDANDRYANQEVAYLLQRIEDFPGVAILATNFKNNVDDAFTRRFQSIVYFPMPSAEQRLLLWKNAFSGPMPVSSDIDWGSISRQYELAGGAIINVLRSCALAAVQRTPAEVTMEDVIRGIRKELRKEGKSGNG